MLRRIGVVSLVVLAASGVAAASGAAEGLDWGVNGSPLAVKATAKVKLESLTPTKIASPAAGITFVCAKFTATGTATGGDPGTLTFKPKLAKCVVEGQKKCHVHAFDFPPFAEGQADWVVVEEPGGESYVYPTWQVINIEVEPLMPPLDWRMAVSKCPQEGEYEIVGGVDSNVTSMTNAEFTLPKVPLEHSQLTVRGKPAIWTGSYKFVLAGKGTVSFVVVKF